MKKIKYSEITQEKIYKNRRSFIKSIGLGASSFAISNIPFANKSIANERDKLTSYKDITTYNNYYEFGTSKSDPDKKIISEQTLDFIKNFKTNDIDGSNADDAILGFIKENRSIVATMDKELKNKIKQSGSSILSIHNDKIVIEN